LQIEFVDLIESVYKISSDTVLLIPTSPNLGLSKDQLQFYILEPSPYYKDQYLPIRQWGDKTKSSTIENYILKDGDIQFKILAEEMSFSINMCRYRILYLDRDLPGVPSSEQANVDMDQLHFLCNQLKQSYTYVDGYFDDFIRKLGAIYADLSGDENTEMLIWRQLFEWAQPLILHDFETRDLLLYNAFKTHCTPHLTAKQFGVSDHLAGIELQDLITKMESMELLPPPEQRAKLRFIFDSIPAHVQRQLPDEQMLSADDTLPLLIYILVRAQPQLFHSCLQMAKASLSTLDSETEYILTNYEVACQYLLGDSLNPRLLSRRLRPVTRPLSLTIPSNQPISSIETTEESEFLKKLKQMEDGTSSTFAVQSYNNA
jgi:hypothetical protein